MTISFILAGNPKGFLIDDFDMTRKRRKEVVDKLAAAHILQGALDHLHRMKNSADD